MFNVFMAWSINAFQRTTQKSFSVSQIPVTKWYLSFGLIYMMHQPGDYVVLPVGIYCIFLLWCILWYFLMPHYQWCWGWLFILFLLNNWWFQPDILTLLHPLEWYWMQNNKQKKGFSPLDNMGNSPVKYQWVLSDTKLFS